MAYSVTMDPWAPTDPFGEALHVLRMSGAFYSPAELTAPWGMTLPPLPGYLWFHLVASGRFWLEVEGGGGEWLEAGDLALVPHGEGHVLASEPGVDAPGILELDREIVSERFEYVRHDGGGARTTLICGAVRFEHPAASRLVDALPPIIRVDASDAERAEWMQSTLRLIASEARALRPGGEAVITRLADVLVVQALRWWLASDPAARTGWLGALRDPRIGRAIALIHRDPAGPWTVESLAKELSMSRSAFAARFTELVGEPAMKYVTRWRMHVAHAALRDEGATIAQLASRLGYRSEAAFARAFKRVMGIPPGAAKRSRPVARLGAAAR
jgi:AraC-like DNA-binding protein